MFDIDEQPAISSRDGHDADPSAGPHATDMNMAMPNYGMRPARRLSVQCTVDVAAAEGSLL